MASQEKSITLGAIAEIDLQGQSIPLLLSIELDGSNTVFLMLGENRFEFSQPNQKGFIARYKNDTGNAFNISELLGELIPNLADELPGDLKINLEQVTIAYQKILATEQPNNSTLLVSARLGFNINLAQLPLIGDKIPADKYYIDSFQIAYVSQNLKKTSASDFAEDLDINLERFTNDEDIVLPSGVNLSAELKLDNDRQFLSLPLSKPNQNQPKPHSNQNPSDSPEARSTALSTKFTENQAELSLELNKAIGPIAFQKIGVQYRFKESELWFFLNASLSVGGLTLACNNLAVGSSIEEFKPKFSLDGISIHYSGSDTVEIGGAFLRKTREREDGTNYEEYSGAATISTKLKDKKITLTAIGSYTEIEGEASLFIFALLDYPLGGPPIFFVTGLAAGFGYNRTLKVPKTIEAVADFPLVRLAMGEQPSKSVGQEGKPDLPSIIEFLGPYIPPARDEMFFAVGVKFTSFKIVETFLLLIFKLGKKLEIHILGLAILKAPPALEGDDAIEPVAEARLAIRAVFIPDDGIFQVEAVLAEGSYIFSKKCHLSGRFAFYTWFSGVHEGDFVLTLGGYHPKFKIPDHYPRVPRVKFNWQLDKYLSLKGSAYFALTPSALMVGGGLEASYHKGSVKASFKIEADFLVAWQPFYYKADISVEIRASARIDLWLTETTISLNIGASLSIWGPPFAGRAKFKIGPISVTIKFGDSSDPKPKPLSWSQFQKSLLPATEEVCSISISDGLLNKLEEEKQEIWIVNAKELVLVTQSAVPSSRIEIKGIEENSISDISDWNKEIDIRPMGVRSKDFEATYKISVKRDGQLVNEDFKYQPIYKNVPSAVWKAAVGDSPHLPPGANEKEKLIEKALCGFEIQPGAKPTPGATQEIDYKDLLSDTSDGSKYHWNQKISISNHTIDKNDIIDKLAYALENKTNYERRQNLLNSLELKCNQNDITISKSFTEELLGTPNITSLS